MAAGAAALVAVSGACTVRPLPVDARPGGQEPQRQRSPAPPTPGSSPAASPAASPSSRPQPQDLLLAPGDEGGKVRELQARLRALDWFFAYPNGTYDAATSKAVRGFQGKRGLPRTGAVDPLTWQKLLGMSREPGYFERYAGGDQPAAKPDGRCLTGRVLCISKKSRTLTWMVDGKAVETVDVRFGSQYTPTREGEFSVYWKSRHHVSTLYDTPMPYAMFFSGGQAVHYSSDFRATGYTGASHGCVNVRDEKKIASLYAQVRKGDKVVIYW